jgi:hypothetical protein
MARAGRDLLLSHLHETCRWYPRGAVTVRRDFPANCEKEGEPTSGLEPLTPAHYVRSYVRCRGVQEIANPAFLGGFLCSGVLSVAPYCVPDGVRVVSISPSNLPNVVG